MVSALALYSDDPGSNLGLLNSLLNLIQFKKKLTLRYIEFSKKIFLALVQGVHSTYAAFSV